MKKKLGFKKRLTKGMLISTILGLNLVAGTSAFAATGTAVGKDDPNQPLPATPMTAMALTATPSIVQNPDGSYTYTQKVTQATSGNGGFGYYCGYNQDFGWVHDFPDWNAPGLSILSAKMNIHAADVDSETFWGYNGEYDGVSVDGTMLNPGYLQGQNDQWSDTLFDVPLNSITDDGNINVWLDIDMHTNGNWVTDVDSSTLTITYTKGATNNQAPFKPTVTYTPNGAVWKGNDLSVNVTGPNPADPDNDPVHYEYRWFVDVGTGGFVDDEFAGRGNHTGNTVPAADTQVGDIWRVQVTPIDSKGAIGQFETVTFSKIDSDTVAPVTHYSLTPIYEQNTQGNYVKGLTFGTTATDDKSGIAKTEYRLNGGAWTQFINPFPIFAGQTHKLEYFSTDNAGNKEVPNIMDFDHGTFTGTN